jgi:hypothetical protein
VRTGPVLPSPGIAGVGVGVSLPAVGSAGSGRQLRLRLGVRGRHGQLGVAVLGEHVLAVERLEHRARRRLITDAVEDRAQQRARPSTSPLRHSASASSD